MRESTQPVGSNKSHSGQVLSPSQKQEDHRIEQSIRPGRLSNVIGRKKECELLRILIDAAVSRKESVDHILFHGPPGLGKTTFAHVVANEMESSVRVTSGPAIERQGDLAAILTNLKANDVLFIDEIHRLNRGIEEILYPAMEDYKLDIVVGKGPSARSIRLKLPRFTLIGATTRVSLISSPLRDRFGFIQRLDYFEVGALTDIVLRAAELSKVKISHDGAGEVATRSRGTARVALRLFRRVRDYCQVKHKGCEIDKEKTDIALSGLGVDVLGLDDLDRKILGSIVEKFNGGPVGLSTIAAAVSEEIDTISEVYEPFLIQTGLIKRTSRGRMATEMAFKHLGLVVPKNWSSNDNK